MSEAELLAAIRNALVTSGRVMIWRNNSGMLRAEHGRVVRFGLGLGSADLIGLVRGTGRFFELEVKSPRGTASPEQRAWIAAVEAAGGFARVVRSVDEALAALEEAGR